MNFSNGPHIYIYIIYIRAVIAQSVKRWATGWTIGVLGFDSRRRLGIFLFTTGSGAHPTSYPMGTSGCFPGGKAAGT
jgi:hypothetical protein